MVVPDKEDLCKWNHMPSYVGLPKQLEDIRLLLDQCSEANVRSKCRDGFVIDSNLTNATDVCTTSWLEAKMALYSSTEDEDEDEDSGGDKGKDKGRDKDVYGGRGEDEEDEDDDHNQEEESTP
ncbi:hypothetical protein Golax_003318 [Gossypium laxum]|uniref:Uncharacterized protein n=1 Tax=Gossypium laxum TaxID=34288 RepID=A0A7J9AF02_9ROSI|nr:hypothetical protein [Gossypium laxum]